MIARYDHLSQYPNVFQSMTGLKLNEFIQLAWEITPLLAQARLDRLQGRERKRAVGGGMKPELTTRDQLLLSVIWLRLYPTNVTLGFLFKVSQPTVSRVLDEVVPFLAASGKDTFKMPKPLSRKKRPGMSELLNQVPELHVVVDSFEQRVQRLPKREEADRYYSGKKKQHTLKSQVCIEAATGLIFDISESVVGPTGDIKLLKQSGVLERLPKDVNLGGDLGYPGLAKLRPTRGHIPRRKPRGKERPAEDVAYNTAFSSQRIVVEHTIGRLRIYQALSQADRHHRKLHTQRVLAVVGLVNRQLESRVSVYRRKRAAA